MFRKKGVTLIEIIVAIAVLGIISIGFMPALIGNLKFLDKTEELTVNTFLSQSSMELAIENMKNDIQNDTGSMTYDNDTFFDNVSLNYKEVSNTANGITYTTYVSQTRLPEEAKLNLLSAYTRLYKDVKLLYSTYPLSDRKIVGNVVNEPSENHMTNIYEWYVSDYGFNIPAPQGNDINLSTYDYLDDINEIDIGNKYPIFPDDYSLISNVTINTLNDLSDYAGRHIVLKAAPASKTGKIGNAMWTNPIFVSGLTELTNLSVHLDASFIDPSKTSGDDKMVEVSGTDIKVSRWYDLSSEPTGASDYYPSQFGTFSGMAPELHENPIDASFVSRYVSFVDSGSIELTDQGTRNSTLTVYAVVRGNPGDIILKNGSSSNNNSFVIPADDSGNVEIIGNSGEGTRNWKIVKNQISAGNHNRYNNFLFGSSNVDIAEIIVYKGNHDSSKVDEYLDKKYKPYKQEFVIDRLYDMTVELDALDPYTPPTAVKAKMLYGGDRYVMVTWSNNGNAVDTSNDGDTIITKTFTGTSIISDTNPVAKTMTLTVKIYPRVKSVSVTPETLTLNPGDTHELNVSVLPDAARNKTVIWQSDSSAVSVSEQGLVTANHRGTATITATTEDGGKTDTVSVTVNNISNLPSGLVLHLDATNVDSLDLNGSRVTTWRDLSGFEHHFTQGDNGDRPVVKQDGPNGNSVIKFTPNNFLKCNDVNVVDFGLFDSNNSDFTYFLVGKNNGTDYGYNTMFSQYKNDNTSSFLFGTNNNDFVAYTNGLTRTSIQANAYYNIHTVVRSGNRVTQILNGIVSDTENEGNSKSIGKGFVLGAANAGTSNFFEGEIAEVIIFNRVLDNDEIEFVESYLETKWINIVYSWDFTSGVEGWSALSGINQFGYHNDGFLVGRTKVSSESERYIKLDSPGINVEGDKANRLVIRMKTTSGSEGKIAFKAQSNDNWRVITFSIDSGNQYHEYMIDLTDNNYWSGEVDEFEISPIRDEGNASFSIDYIKILE